MLRTQAANNDSGMFQDEDPGVQLGTSIIADDQNNHQEEIVNSILAANIALAADQNQLAKSIASHSLGADFHIDSGVADAYVLTPVLSFESPDSYFDGMGVRFLPTNANTGPSTINVGGLGVKSIEYRNSALRAGDLSVGDLAILHYDLAKDKFILLNGKNRFELKTLSSNITTDTVISDLTFTLTPGHTYEITLICRVQIDPVDGLIDIAIKDGATTIENYRFDFVTSAGEVNSREFSFPYTMTSSSLTFESMSASVNAFIRGNGTRLETHVIVKEIPNVIEGTVS